MTDDPGAGSAVVAFDELLAEAKLSVPRPRPGAGRRAGLIATARASDCRVVGVTGYVGKGAALGIVGVLVVIGAAMADPRAASTIEQASAGKREAG